MSAAFLGIDVGSTRTKAVVLGAEGSTALAAAAAPTPVSPRRTTAPTSTR